MEEIKILELFSGYGGASFALKKANIPHKCIGYSDIEECANYIFSLNHGEDVPQLGNVININPDDLEDFDLCTFGFPCQSFSIAGKRQGFAAANKGRLFFEVIRILESKHPRYALGENVQGLLSHDNGKTFEVVLHELKRIGYYVSWQLLFSKEHGTPQNRPRVWIACFREKEDYDKFMFPEKEQLKITVKDLLEDEVDVKYYLNDNQIKRINETMEREYNFQREPQDLDKVFRTLTAHMGRDKLDIPYFKIADFRYDEGVRVRDNGVSPTSCSSQKGGNGLSSCPIICDDGASENFRTYRDDGVSPTLKSSRSNYALKETSKQWRRLTPKECFRLQGFFKDEINFGKLKDSKLYFLAGNGWDINVASKIFIQMFKGNNNKQKLLYDLI